MKLKTIIEEAGFIPAAGQQSTHAPLQSPSLPFTPGEPQKMSQEQKKQLLELVSKYNQCGKTLYEYGDVRQVAETLLQIGNLAESYALQESDKEFLEVGNITKDFKDIKKDVSELNKIAKEAWAANERMKSCYENVGHRLGKYYDLN